MARWLRDRLLFRSAKPAPPQPDYAPGPDLVAAYRLQRERDFEDPYAPAGARPAAPRPAGPRSPRRRLIRVEAAEAEKMAALEDYADPFDNKEEMEGPTKEQERVKNEGYVEPYEAQKMLAEVQKRGSDDGPAISKPLHLYDIPYEACESDTDADGRNPSDISFRYSWLPEDDERPPEEYDQPWEWKKDRISRVFAVEIEGIKELPWPPPVGQLDSMANRTDAEGSPNLQSIGARCVSADSPPNFQNTSSSLPDSVAMSSSLDDGKGTVKSQLPSGTEKRSSLCWLSVEPGLTFGERVNPTLPLESQAQRLPKRPCRGLTERLPPHSTGGIMGP